MIDRKCQKCGSMNTVLIANEIGIDISDIFKLTDGRDYKIKKEFTIDWLCKNSVIHLFCYNCAALSDLLHPTLDGFKPDLLQKYFSIRGSFYNYVVMNTNCCYPNFFGDGRISRTGLELTEEEYDRWKIHQGKQPTKYAPCRIIKKYDDRHLIIEEKESRGLFVVTLGALVERKY